MAKFEFDMAERIDFTAILVAAKGGFDELEALLQIADFIRRLPKDIVDQYSHDFVSLDEAIVILNEAKHGDIDAWEERPLQDGGTYVAYTYPGGYNYAISEGQAILIAEGILRARRKKEAANG